MQYVILEENQTKARLITKGDAQKIYEKFLEDFHSHLKTALGSISDEPGTVYEIGHGNFPDLLMVVEDK